MLVEKIFTITKGKQTFAFCYFIGFSKGLNSLMKIALFSLINRFTK